MTDKAALTDCATSPELIAKLTETRFPVFFTVHGLALWPLTDSAAGPPAIVLSIPKSGTYFTEALYKRMGYSSVFVHALDRNCTDRRLRPHNPTVGGNVPMPITLLSRLVLPGQIIVSHCG